MTTPSTPQVDPAVPPEPTPPPEPTTPSEPTTPERNPPAGTTVDAPTPETAGARPQPRELRLQRIELCAVIVIAVVLGAVGTILATRDHPPTTKSVDVGFLRDLATRNRRAVDIAAVATRTSDTADVAALARSITLDQGVELEEMDRQLRQWRHSTTPNPDPLRWMGTFAERVRLGTPTDREVRNLRNAAAADIDGRLVELMALQHQGSLDTARVAMRRAGDKWVRLFAYTVALNRANQLEALRATAVRLGLDLDEPSADPADVTAEWRRTVGSSR